MSNLELWNKVARPPKEALKTIKGGRLSGMTDVNPQWRLKVMTENFGPCGKGWWYTIDKIWNEPGPEGAVMAFALVSVTINGHSPVQGVGGSMLVAKESAGLRANDEAYKMAVTDALSTSLKTLGIAADIYFGLWDGSKYLDAPKDDGAIKPTDGARGRVTPARRKVVEDTAVLIGDALNEDRDFDAYGYCENFTDADEKVYLWSFLDSKQRSRLKAQAEVANRKVA